MKWLAMGFVRLLKAELILYVVLGSIFGAVHLISSLL